MSPLPHLSLAGDGDEVAAIEDVEREFGTMFVPNERPQWLTIGDVFNDLLTALGPDASDDATIWPRFCRAITLDTGDDPSTLVRETRFLMPDVSIADRLRALWPRSH